jgi:hypothetical protein
MSFAQRPVPPRLSLTLFAGTEATVFAHSGIRFPRLPTAPAGPETPRRDLDRLIDQHSWKTPALIMKITNVVPILGIAASMSSDSRLLFYQAELGLEGHRRLSGGQGIEHSRSELVSELVAQDHSVRVLGL